MSKMPIRIHAEKSLDWHRVRDIVPPSAAGIYHDSELDSQITWHERGDEDSLQLFEVSFDPGALVALHAHEHDEIIYIVSGSLILGEREIGPGSSVFVGGETLYGFRAGSKGLRMLNFRPQGGSTYIPKAEFLKRQKSRRLQTGADQ